VPDIPIHVFSEHATRFRDLILEVEPMRDVVAWTDREAFDDGIAQARVVFAPFPPRDGWADAGRLELVQLLGVGADHFLPAPTLPERVHIAGMRGAMADDVAEHVLLMLLALTRDLLGFAADQRAHRWKQRKVARLRGRKLAILGFGSIGAAVAARAAPFGCAIRAVRRHPEPAAGVEAVLGPDRLLDVLRWCDSLVVCTPLTDETRGLVGAEALERLADGALLVDVSRGGVVAPGPLADRLRAGTLRAALDVFEDEPLDPASPLWELPNVVVTPHVSGFGEGYLERAVAMLLENVGRLERGEPLIGLVDRDLTY